MLALFIGLAALLFAPLALNAALNASTFRRIPPAGSPTGARVSLLVPARNEAARIGALLMSFEALDDAEALELLVYDDDSSDETAAIVIAQATRDRRVRLISGGALPAGWGGKVHALQRLSEAARGDHLLFLDADVTLLPGAVARAAAELARAKLDVLSLYPQQVLGGWAERVFVPCMVYYFYFFGSQWLQRLGRRPLVPALNGQFMLWRRAAYDAVGGFAAIRSAWLDDMAIGQLAVQRGLAIAYRPGAGLARCRMYTSFVQAWAGFAKHTWDAFSQPAPVFLALQGYVFVAGALPFWLALGTGLMRPLSPVEWAALTGWAALVGFTRLLACVQCAGGWISALTHPLSLTGAVANSVYSYHLARTRRSAWRGRTRAEIETV